MEMETKTCTQMQFLLARKGVSVLVLHDKGEFPSSLIVLSLYITDFHVEKDGDAQLLLVVSEVAHHGLTVREEVPRVVAEL